MRKEDKIIDKKELTNKNSCAEPSSKNLKLLETQIDKHIEVFKRLKDK